MVNRTFSVTSVKSRTYDILTSFNISCRCFAENRRLLERRVGACVEDDESASKIEYSRWYSYDAVGRRCRVLLGDRYGIVVNGESYSSIRFVHQSSSSVEVSECGIALFDYQATDKDRLRGDDFNNSCVNCMAKQINCIFPL